VSSSWDGSRSASHPHVLPDPPIDRDDVGLRFVRPTLRKGIEESIGSAVVDLTGRPQNRTCGGKQHKEIEWVLFQEGVQHRSVDLAENTCSASA
jgi:hypothetical protein